MSHLNSFSRYQTKCVIEDLFRQFINVKIFLKSISKAMIGREKKEGKTKIQKYEYLENKKRFFDEIKNVFHSF